MFSLMADLPNRFFNVAPQGSWSVSVNLEDMANLVGISSESTSIPNNSRSNKALTSLKLIDTCPRPAGRGGFFLLAKVQSRNWDYSPLTRGLGGLFSSRKDAKSQRNSSQFFAPSLLCAPNSFFLLAKTQSRKEIVVHLSSATADSCLLAGGLCGLASLRAIFFFFFLILVKPTRTGREAVTYWLCRICGFDQLRLKNLKQKKELHSCNSFFHYEPSRNSTGQACLSNQWPTDYKTRLIIFQ